MDGKVTFINRLLGRAGFELHKPGHKISSLLALPRLPTAGWVVEVIGTQGVGKTTLNNVLHKHLHQQWFFRSDLGQTGRAPASSEVLEELHRDLLFQKLDHLRHRQPDAWKSLTISRQMSKVIGESLTILSNDFPRGFVLDESIFKNLPHEVLSLDEDVAKPLWRKRAFIHLKARDPDFAVSRYQSRVEKRAQHGVLQSKPADADVLARVKADNVLFDKIAAKAATIDCPVLVLYAEDSREEHIQKVLEFEKSLHSGD